MEYTKIIVIFFCVICLTLSEKITMKLVGGRVAGEGNLYVKRGSDWGLVCDDNWNMKAGDVVCKQLGYQKVQKVTSYNQFKSPYSDKIFLDDVTCMGYEKNLGECKHREWLKSNCHAGEAAGVVCDTSVSVLTTTRATTTRTTTTARATTSTTGAPTVAQGRIEIHTKLQPYDGEGVSNEENSVEEEWIQPEEHLEQRSSREESWRVSSREESWRVSSRASHEDMMTRASELRARYRANIQRDAAELRGESGVLDFSNPAGAPEPVSDDEIQKVDELIKELTVDMQDVKSHKAAKPYKLEIVGGRSNSEGYVKVHLDNGKSGAICSDKWGLYEAMVVCREAGHKFASRATTSDFFRGKNEDKVFYEVNCDGHEKRLADCEYKLTSEDGVKCSKPGNVAGVLCTAASLPDLLPNVRALKSSMHIQEAPLASLTCAMEEGCLASSAYTQRRTSLTSNYGSSSGFAGILDGVLPDLLPNITTLETSTTLQDKYMGHLACSMEENCLASSAYEMKERYNRRWTHLTRRLLRFSSSIFNNGTADFKPKQHRSTWEWHSCHMHYHSMDTFSRYDILDSHGNRVAEGHKASFCLEDVECEYPHRKKYSCGGFGDQGISVGCADVYKFDIDCQWIDITDLKPGAYVFKLNVNPEMLVPELSFDNNAAICELNYTGYSVKLNNCVLARG